MRIIENKCTIRVLESTDEMPAYLERLMGIAIDQLNMAYAPYSNFYVGAAVLTEDGQIFKGCNQENASYPLCMCAERVALYNKGANSNALIKAIAIVANNPIKPLKDPVSPCGACRQVILEFEQKQSQEIEIFLKGDEKTIYHIKSASDLLPFGFEKSNLI